jgi:SET domain
VATSRAFAVRGPRRPRALLPAIDMCNHSFAPNCDISKDAGGAVMLATTRAVAAGEQLLLSYGALDNHTLLLDYGFCVPDNPFDNVALNVSPAALLVRCPCAMRLAILPLNASPAAILVRSACVSIISRFCLCGPDTSTTSPAMPAPTPSCCTRARRSVTPPTPCFQSRQQRHAFSDATNAMLSVTPPTLCFQ